MRRTLGAALVSATALALAFTTLAPAPAQAAPQQTLKQVQYRLWKLGCQPGALTGKPNDRTKYAIIKFQAANALLQTGKLNDNTRAKLRKPEAIACNARPVPVKTGTGKRIVMSQKQNWVWLVRANGTIAHQGGIIDNTQRVRPGAYATGTKCGRSGKIRKNKSWDYKYDLDYFVRFVACGIGFHRVPTYPGTNRQIHEDYLLGTNAMTSGGCVRVSLETSRKMWHFTTANTKVVVVADR